MVVSCNDFGKRPHFLRRGGRLCLPLAPLACKGSCQRYALTEGIPPRRGYPFRHGFAVPPPLVKQGEAFFAAKRRNGGVRCSGAERNKYPWGAPRPTPIDATPLFIAFAYVYFGRCIGRTESSAPTTKGASFYRREGQSPSPTNFPANPL